MEITKIKTDKFKTNETAVFLTVPLNRENITMNALIPSVLRRGTANYKDQIGIGKQLENMYGAFFNCGIDKTGDYCILKFYIETIGDRFLPDNEKVSQKAIDLLMEIIFEPYTENGTFCKEYVSQEKDNLRRIIESKKDNKELYAFNRCIEEMFKNQPYGISKNGYIEDLDAINEKNLYEYYKKLISEARVDIFTSGPDANDANIKVEKEGRNDLALLNTNNKPEISKTNIIKEQSDVVQGKLILGLYSPNNNKFAVSLYNAILGGGTNSKLFQNVREKASLAYSIGSRYIRRKDAIFIITGIELQNYEKALKIIKKQITDMEEEKISDDEFNKVKQLVVSSLELLKESQENMITFALDQRLFEENLTIDKYISNIKKVTKKDVINIAKQIKIGTIYYLENS